MDLDDIHDRQAGVARRRDWYAAGLSQQFVALQLGQGRWQQLGPVVVAHNGPLTEEQVLWVAVESARTAGVPVALAGRTAAARGGLKGWPGSRPEIVVPKGARPAVPPELQVRIHESRRFTQADVTGTPGLPAVSVHRALTDAATWTRPLRGACGLLLAGVQQRLTTAERLLTELDKAGRVRHGRLLRLTVSDAAGGSQALTEVDLGRVLARAGLPRPDRQVVRVVDGRRRYVDARVTGPDGRSILIEVDGALHLLPLQAWGDAERLNELVILGDRVLRFPSVALHLAPDLVASQVARALGLTVRPRARKSRAA